MHLKRKDSIKLKNIRKWMEGKIPVLHELSIHSEFLTTNFSNLYDFSFSPMEVSCRNGQKGSIHIET